MSWLSLKLRLFSFKEESKNFFFPFMQKRFSLSIFFPKSLFALLFFEHRENVVQRHIFPLSFYFSYSQVFFLPEEVLYVKEDGNNLGQKAQRPYSLNFIRPYVHNSKAIASKRIKNIPSCYLEWRWGLRIKTCSFFLCTQAQGWPIFPTRKPNILYIPLTRCLFLDPGAWLPLGPLWK